VRWPRGENRKGIGWVEFSDSTATDKAVEKSGAQVMGRAIRVDYATPRSNRD